MNNVKNLFDLFQQMLNEAGIDIHRATPGQVWPVFKRFCDVPITGQPDPSPARSGSSQIRYEENAQFEFSFSSYYLPEERGKIPTIERITRSRLCVFFRRSFVKYELPLIEEDEDKIVYGGYAGVEDIECVFVYSTTQDPDELGNRCLSRENLSNDDFFQLVEADADFQLICASYVPIRSAISLG
ncbi:MAG: hypothetical protein HY774_25525 [Acidobacteria bacterium]|nr:hypothetical protein [Acidobacteriota bacterium]